MRRLERRFQGTAPDQTGGALTNARTVWFNAWTASEAQVLEGLVRSVLNERDESILRRVARQKKLMRGLGIGASAAAGLLGVGNIVDRIWAATSIDPKQRNELNDLVRAAMTDWLDRARTIKGRMIVVFIDDLDRCTPATVIRVFEAMKLYLDAPGFVFVLGWDTEQVMRAVATERGADIGSRTATSRRSFSSVSASRDRRGSSSRRSQPRTATQQDSRATSLANAIVSCSSARRTAIHANSSGSSTGSSCCTTSPPMAPTRWRSSSCSCFSRPTTASTGSFPTLRATRTPRTRFEFADYLAARQALDRQNASEVERVLAPRGYSGPEWPTSFSAFERDLPQEYPLLAADRQFVALLKLTSADDKRKVRDLARSAQLDSVEQPETHEGGTIRGAPSDFYVPPGTTVLWIDDQPKTSDHALLPSTVELIVATSQREAERVLSARDWSVDLVISDIGRRRESRNAGLEGLAELRRRGYKGPAIFYTMGVTSGQVEDARNLDAQVTTAPAALRDAVYRHLARAPTEAEREWDRSMVKGKLAERKWEQIDSRMTGEQ